MKIVLAPDSFKGSLTASAVVAAMEKGIRAIIPEAEITGLPLSDGGEGLVDSLISASGGKIFPETVTGPLGKKVQAFWGVMGDGATAVIETAAASGLLLAPKEKKNPLLTTTYGTGELVRAALDYGCRRLIIGIGGSATNDGGAGMAQALGARLLTGKGRDLPFGGGSLSALERIDLANIDHRLRRTEVLAACDVKNPLTGPEGAAYVYGPQKGATPEMVKLLDEGLKHFARVVAGDLGIEVETLPGSGAAGGLGAGLVAFLQGKLVPGIELVMNLVGLEKEIQDCALVLTGEGKLDAQSIYGKVPVGVARAARKFGVPVIALAGSLAEDLQAIHEEGITACFSIVGRPVSLDEAMKKAAFMVETTTKEVMRFWARAMKSRGKTE